MRLAILLLAAGALFASVAQANDRPVAASADMPPAAKPASATSHEPAASSGAATAKVLYVCSENETYVRQFARGIDFRFVTAEQALADAGEAWSGPRCITPTEARRLAAMQKLAAK